MYRIKFVGLQILHRQDVLCLSIPLMVFEIEGFKEFQKSPPSPNCGERGASTKLFGKGISSKFFNLCCRIFLKFNPLKGDKRSDLRSESVVHPKVVKLSQKLANFNVWAISND